MITTLAKARAWDAEDPLNEARSRFSLPEGVIYLDGNSLGPPPAEALARMADAVGREWGEGLVRSWNAADWIGAPQRVGAKIARLIGAAPHEVIVADSTSVNLFKLIAAALALRAPRRTIVTETGDFPTDLYVADGAARTLGATLRAVPPGELEAAIDEDVAVVALTEIHYRTGERRDMAGLTRAAHEAGALILWDLSHSAGAVKTDLRAAGADLAVGCGYKYLNGGPGAPAYLFAAERLHESLASPLTGWMGHADPFAFVDEYRPAPGIDRFLAGTPPILSLLALECAVDQLADLDMAVVAQKGQRLCSLFIERVEATCGGEGLTLITPRDPARRGSQVSFAHAHAWPIMQAMIARGVIGDFRAPDVLRCGFAPLYLSFEDVWRAADTLADILKTSAWRDPKFQTRARVT